MYCSRIPICNSKQLQHVATCTPQSIARRYAGHHEAHLYNFSRHCCSNGRSSAEEQHTGTDEPWQAVVRGVVSDKNLNPMEEIRGDDQVAEGYIDLSGQRHVARPPSHRTLPTHQLQPIYNLQAPGLRVKNRTQQQVEDALSEIREARKL